MLLKKLHTAGVVVASLIVRKYLHIVLSVDNSTSSRRWVTIVVLSALFRRSNYFDEKVVSLRGTKDSGLSSSSVVGLGLLTTVKSLARLDFLRSFYSFLPRIISFNCCAKSVLSATRIFIFLCIWIYLRPALFILLPVDSLLILWFA